jgi:P-type Mg2+ transporter
MDRSGLSSSEAASRLVRYGPNRIESENRPSILRAFWDRCRNPLILMLIAAGAISAATGDVNSFVIITVIVLLSIVLDVVQEHRAGDAAQRLRSRVSLTATAVRDGKACELPAAQLVPGDVVLLKAGDLVPADGTLVESRDLYINEALLTGESFPAEKRAAVDTATAGPQNQIFMGSSIVSGTATAVLAATGKNAQLGGIAGSLRRPAPHTAFVLGVREFSGMIVKITLLLVLFTLLVNLLLHRPVLESFLFAVALAVGLTPELLPMIVSVTLAQGALRLSRKEVIVKKLSSIHDLGSMDVLCSDKTGTLTQASIVLVQQVDAFGEATNAALKLARINAVFETGIKSPLDDAILAAPGETVTGWTKLDEVPFDFERRRVSVLAEGEGRRLTIVKGAPEDILVLASRHQPADGPPAPMDAAARARAEEVLAGLGADGLRVLAVAWREAAPDCLHAALGDERDVIFAGFLGFLDPPKDDAGAALAELAALGVRVKILTGDNADVTRHVCRAIGLDRQGILTGAEISALSEEALEARLDATGIFCRVTPSQKLRILSALRRQGHVVGFLGDGINDAPALHEADIGFSVDSGVDVAKAAAGMILLRKDLGVLADGVREGRRTYANILKYVMMATSSNFGNMFSMTGGALLLPFLPMLPVQILLNNLLYDFSELAIPMDRVDPVMLARPRRWDMKVIRHFMIVLGSVSSLFDFLTFFILLRLMKADEMLFHTGWFVESMATQIFVIFILRSATPFKSLPHPFLVVSSLVVVLLAVLLPFTPLAGALGFVPLSATLLAAIAMISVAYLALVYLVRRWLFFRHSLI